MAVVIWNPFDPRLDTDPAWYCKTKASQFPAFGKVWYLNDAREEVDETPRPSAFIWSEIMQKVEFWVVLAVCSFAGPRSVPKFLYSSYPGSWRAFRVARSTQTCHNTPIKGTATLTRQNLTHIAPAPWLSDLLWHRMIRSQWNTSYVSLLSKVADTSHKVVVN